MTLGRASQVGPDLGLRGVGLAPRGVGGEGERVQGRGHVAALRHAIHTRQNILVVGGTQSGKTTLAGLLATETSARMVSMSAVTAGVADLRKVVAEARVHRRAGLRTVLFIDEIHRFNKAQQDALLPAVEDGLVTLIGATTENPYFEVNSALISRARVYELDALSPDHVRSLLDRALERGACPAPVDPEALDQAIRLTRPAGSIQCIGVYAERAEVHMGLLWLKSLTLRGGQANVIRHVDRVLEMMAAGALLSLWAALLFRQAGTTIKPFRQSSALVSRGPYNVTRNPMYLGMVIALIGVAIRLGSLTPFVVVPVFAFVIQTSFIQSEERLLEETFGPEYARYRARVRRWL